MATSVTFNGTSYSIPVVGERQWGTNVSNFLIAVAGNALSKAGGSFVLTTADVNFGATYGLVTAYLKSASSNISSAGVIRFANNEGIGWRNFANAANLILLVNASDRLEFGGVAVPTISSTDTLTNKTMSGASNTFTNLPVGTTGVTAIANGGTGQSAIVTTPTASTIPAWDANANLSANNLINEYATVVTAAGTTTLTVSSKRTQFFTGTTTQTVTLPVASTLAVGHSFYIRNLSTGVVTLQSSGANTVLACQPGEWLTATCILASGTTAASWSTFAKLSVNTVETGAFGLPAGTAAQRPTAIAGQVRLNTDSNSFEGYANGTWASIGGGLNELPQKNYLKTYSDSAVAPGTLSTLASTTANLVSLTAFYADATSGASALSSSTSSLLRGTTNYLTAAGAADSTGARFIQFPAQQLEGTDIGKPVSLYFDVNGVTADGNWDAVIVRYNSSGVHQSIISVAGNASTGTTPVSAKIPTGTTTFNGFFVPDSTTTTDLYALRLRHLVSNAAIRVDTLFIGPQPIRVGNARTGRQSYTPTGPFTVTTTYTGFWSRDNEDILIDLSIAFSGAPTGTNAAFTHAQVLNGLGLTVDTTKLSGGGGSATPCGTWSVLDLGVTVYGGPVAVTGTNVDLYTAAGVLVTKTNPLTIGNTDAMSISIRLPIVGWSSNITMADRSVESYAADDGSSDVFGPNGALVPNIGTGTSTTSRAFTFQEAKQATDSYILEYNNSGNGWSNQNGIWVFIGGTLSFFFGMRGYWSSSTVYTVDFGNGGTEPSNGLGAASSTAWSSRFTAGDRFRVRRVSGGAQVGYPISPNNLVKSIARFTTAAGQSIPNGGAPTIVDFGTKVYDLKGEVATGASWKFTAAQTGYYRVNAYILFLQGGGWAAGESVLISVFKNGTSYAIAETYQTATHTTYPAVGIGTTIQLNAGEYLDVRAAQTSGAALTLFTDSKYQYVDIEQIN